MQTPDAAIARDIPGDPPNPGGRPPRDAAPVRRIDPATVTLDDVKQFADGIIERFEESRREERSDEAFLLYMLACHFKGLTA